MKTLIPAIVAVLGSFGTADANPMTVRSGDHPGFTRITIAPVPVMDWDLSRTGSTYVLRIANSGSQFDLSQAFARISRSRLTAITAAGDTLRLELACACDVDVFRAGAQLLAVDIRDAQETPTTPSPNLPNEAFDVQTDPKLPPASQSFSDIWIQDLLRSTLRAELEVTVPEAAPKREMRRSLPDGQTGESVHLQMRVHDPNATGERHGFASIGHDPLGAACPTDRELEFLHAELSDDPFEDLANLRRDAFTVTGRVDANVAFDLVERYIALGLGKEANELAGQFRLSGRRAEIAEKLALIIEDEPLPTEIWPIAPTCSPRALFWALLASPSLTTERLKQTEVDALVQYFSELRTHLQRIAGSRLAARFAQQGYDEAAARTREIARRAYGKGPQDLDVYANTVGASDETQTRLADHHRRAEFEDVLARANLNWRNQTPMQFAERELLESFAFERRGHADANVATEALIRSALLSGDLTEAGDLLDRLAQRASDQIKADFLQAVLQAPSDADFLVSAQRLSLSGVFAAEPEVAELAARANSLGFRSLADDLARMSGLPFSVVPSQNPVSSPPIQTQQKDATPSAPLPSLREQAPLQSARDLLTRTGELRAELAKLRLDRQ